MKKVIGIALVALIAGCQPPVDSESMKAEIKENNKQIKELTVINDSLQLILNNDSNIVEVKGTIVEAHVLSPETFNSYFSATGSVEALQDAFISPEMNGQIKKVHVKEGDRVTKGQVLVTLNTSMVDKSIAEIKTRLELATDIFEKQEKLWKDKIGSEIQFLQAKNNKEALENSLSTVKAQRDLSIVNAPFSGIVDEIFFKEGEIASPGLRLINLVNLKSLKISADISESFLPKLKKGDIVSVTFPAFPGMKYDLPIHRIGNVVHPANRTFKVELKLDNPNETLKPNIVAALKINDFTKDSAMVIPSILLKDDNVTKKSFIFKATKESGKLMAKKVNVEEIISYKSESIITGINLGDTIIFKGDVTNNVQIRLSNTELARTSDK